MTYLKMDIVGVEGDLLPLHSTIAAKTQNEYWALREPTKKFSMFGVRVETVEAPPLPGTVAIEGTTIVLSPSVTEDGRNRVSFKGHAKVDGVIRNVQVSISETKDHSTTGAWNVKVSVRKVGENAGGGQKPTPVSAFFA